MGVRRTLSINRRAVEVDADAQMPLLWVLRDVLGLPGTKYGCGRGMCGACTVHVGGEPIRSCLLPFAAVDGPVTTIEDLAATPEHPIVRAWLELDVAQCGYCQAGQIMACAALLRKTVTPSDDDIAGAMSNLCRCGTYQRIRDAVRRAAELTRLGEEG